MGGAGKPPATGVSQGSPIHHLELRFDPTDQILFVKGDVIQAGQVIARAENRSIENLVNVNRQNQHEGRSHNQPPGCLLRAATLLVQALGQQFGDHQKDHGSRS